MQFRMEKLNSDEIKKRVFMILCDFADFCDQNGLRYYLSGGTLLGAIRHKGFIPWDDDVDLLMPRPDFDRLHFILKDKEIKSYYKLIGYNAGVGYYPFAKLVDLRTEIVNQYSTVDKNLWIDIFPMDGLPNDEKEANYMLNYAAPLKINYTRTYAVIGEGKSFFRKIAKVPVKLYLRLFGIKKTTRNIDALARKYSFENSKYVAGIAWSVGTKEKMVKSEYEPIEDVEFNGRMFHAPACWDTYLRQMFGNYMELPPESQRVNHSNDVYVKE